MSKIENGLDLISRSNHTLLGCLRMYSERVKRLSSLHFLPCAPCSFLNQNFFLENSRLAIKKRGVFPITYHASATPHLNTHVLAHCYSSPHSNTAHDTQIHFTTLNYSLWQPPSQTPPHPFPHSHTSLYIKVQATIPHTAALTTHSAILHYTYTPLHQKACA